MIEQVLMNLILNAIQATAEGGEIAIRTHQNEEYCEIKVSDTGSGIPADIRAHIFDPFFTTKKTGEGTGLGLSVSLGIVERHGGQLVVESEVGEGTTFTVRLPISVGRVAAMSLNNTQSGETRLVLVSVSPLLNDQEEVVGMLGIARDITDRKKS